MRNFSVRIIIIFFLGYKKLCNVSFFEIIMTKNNALKKYELLNNKCDIFSLQLQSLELAKDVEHLLSLRHKHEKWNFFTIAS